MEKTFYEMHRSDAVQILLGKHKAASLYTNLKLADLLETHFPEKKRMYLVREDNIDLEGNILTAKTF